MSKVVNTQPFEVVFSVYAHEFLGYLIAAYVVQINSKGEHTYQYQMISPKNYEYFANKLTAEEIECIQLCDEIQQEQLYKKFNQSKKLNVEDFLIKTYDKHKGEEIIRKYIEELINNKKAIILEKLKGKTLYIMGKDGNPCSQKLEWAEEVCTVLFRLHRNSEDSHYYPTIKYKGEKLEFQYQKESFILSNKPAYMVLNNIIYFFTHNVDGKKIMPFLQKKFILISRKIEEEYFNKFFLPLIAWFDVKAVGQAKIDEQKPDCKPILKITEYLKNSSSLFENQTGKEILEAEWEIEIQFQYNEYTFSASENYDNQPTKYEVKIQKDVEKDYYIFYKIKRNIKDEKNYIEDFKNLGLALQKGKIKLPKNQAYSWLTQNWDILREKQINILQPNNTENKRYFLGNTYFEVKIEENRDWFDILAKIKFGNYKIPFWQLRKYILQKKTEFNLPNGEIAVIPSVWLEQFNELAHFSHIENEKDESLRLKKHHLALIEELRNGKYAQVRIHRKLENFKNFEGIEEYPLPKNFKGKLRPYQKTGYDWLRFLNEYKMGGCLADDMGLGKTIMTLALLAHIKEKDDKTMPKTSLLTIPTSLIYNWELEAKKFVPNLKIHVYMGQNRRKDTRYFQHFDVIITSYGIVRSDADLLKNYLFNYIILDESQAIKNPSSHITMAVKELKSMHKLIITGTPLENNTLDLWSQMSFINNGILGTQSFFKNEFQIPIEKKQDEEKRNRLAKIIKPFILRRLKSQVAKDLPEKIENIQYCLMSQKQEEYYEKTKAQYRNELLKKIENQGIVKSQMLLLQGLVKLRQIANHPRLVDENYEGDSGKMEDVIYKLENIVKEGHKVLVFSQFVKHLQLLKNLIEEKKWQYAYLDGSTQKRQNEVEKFQNEKEVKIFLLSLKAGGVGLNLTAAEYVFLLDPWWNPAIEMQAVDRAHRIGQKNTVFTYKFISKNSVEEKILALQENKKKLVKDLISIEDGFIKNITKEDILELFS
jgi:SNF2 family DNA or RNA helicase